MFQIWVNLTETDTVPSHFCNDSSLLLPPEAARASRLILGYLSQPFFPFHLLEGKQASPGTTPTAQPRDDKIWDAPHCWTTHGSTICRQEDTAVVLFQMRHSKEKVIQGHTEILLPSSCSEIAAGKSTQPKLPYSSEFTISSNQL